MARRGQKLKVDIILGTKGKGIEEATKDFKKLGKQFRDLTGTALKLGAGFAAINLGTKMARFTAGAIEESRDLTRNLNGLSTVFEGTSAEMIAFSRNASSMGLSMSQAAKASTFIGSVLKQSGFSIAETSDLTQRLVGLGTDLAITYGYDVQEALLGMTALFRGEYDAIEMFGVDMKRSEINAEMAARELDNLTGASRRLAEQQIRVEFLFDRASDAVGMYSKQAGTLFVAQETLRATFANFEAVVGAALTPAIAELTLALTPLVENLIPIMKAVFESTIPVVKSLTANKEQFANTLIEVIKLVYVVVQVMVSFGRIIVDNIGVVSKLTAGVIAFGISVKVFDALRVTAYLAAGALNTMNISLIRTAKSLKLVKIALVTTGFGAIAVGLGFIAGKVMEVADKTNDGLASLDEELKNFDFDANLQAGVEVNEMLEDSATAIDDLGASAGKAKDTVGDFFRGLADDAGKLSAKLQLETLGASEGLITKILGSGDEWYKVFEEVTRNGMVSVQEVQAMFLQTAAGFDEAMDAWQADFDAFTEFKEAAEESMDAFVAFVREMDILPTVAAELGKFERSAVDRLTSIEEKLKEAFDNGQLLDESYQNLLSYSRAELAVLQGIERQRDELLARRDAASALINSVQKSVRESAKIASILGNVQDAADGVDAVQFASRVVNSGRSLKEFSTALITNFADPIETARSKADLLVDGYRAVVERTREFVTNLKALKALGLDPQLFNQLVQAGVAAGGETAQALVDGGSETVTEINSLFGELDALGMELGENTAQVMYGQGESFVTGIVDGLDSQLEQLESMADSLADSFTTTFEEVLIAGIERAIAAAEAALARMPKAPGFDYTPPGGGGGGGGGGGAGGGSSSSAGTALSTPLANTAFNALQQGAASAAAASRAAALAAVSDTPLSSFAQPTVRVAGQDVSRGNNTYVSIYTSSAPASTANAITRYANTNTGFSFTSQNRRDLK